MLRRFFRRTQYVRSFTSPAGREVDIHVVIEKDLSNMLRKEYPHRKTNFRMAIDDSVGLAQLRDELHSRIPALAQPGQLPFSLQYRIPVLVDVPRTFLTDSDVTDAFRLYFSKPETPSHYIQLVLGSPPQYIPPTDYSPDLFRHIHGMPDPAYSSHYTMVSFFVFRDIPDPTWVIRQLENLWSRFRAFGRIYVAEEGINAQMAVPSNVMDHFKALCGDLPVLKGVPLNVDPVQLTASEFHRHRPFKSLHIRQREQIVVDGFDSPLNWSDAGTELAADEWDRAIRRSDAVVLDCRNGYESDIGSFQGAIPLNTVRFQDSWDILSKTLADKDKDTPVVTYCTGGIRCVKINAFLKQTLGFRNTFRLKGGIVSYARDVQARRSSGSGNNDDMSTFRGVNYVFDDRMGSRVTDDVLAACEMCGSACDSFHNCRNTSCSVRFLQCANCTFSYLGCCSLACKEKFTNSLRPVETPAGPLVEASKRPVRKRSRKSFAVSSVDKRPKETRRHFCTFVDVPSCREDAVEAYCSSMTGPESALLQEVRAETNRKFPAASRMICSHTQGRLLALLSTLHRPKRVLELGTFTGYASLCLSEGLSAGGSWYDGASVLTIEADKEAAAVARFFFDRHESHLGRREMFDLRVNRAQAELLRIQDHDDVQFDMVFLDADKRAYTDYISALLGESSGSRCMLAEGALVVTDNVLWKQLVLAEDKTLEQFSPEASSALEGGSGLTDSKREKQLDRMKRIATHMHKYNAFCRDHPSLTPVVLPIRDGLSLCRYSNEKQKKSADC